MNVTKNKVHILLTVADLKNYQGFCTQNSEKYTI